MFDEGQRTIHELILGGAAAGEVTEAIARDEIRGILGAAMSAPISAQASAEQGDVEVSTETGDAPFTSVSWLIGRRCLVAIGRSRSHVVPFVALVSDKTTANFSRWRRELVRLTLMQASDQWRHATQTVPKLSGLPTAILDRLALPVTAVDAAGQVVYMNRCSSAFINDSRQLRLIDGRLCATSPAVQLRLRGAIRDATESTPRKSHALMFWGEDGEDPPQAVFVTPLQIASGLAMIVCTSGQQDVTMTSLLLSELGLTPTERQLALRLISGERLEDAAKQLNIKVSTARSYLRSVFGKTGATQQSQLVARALSLTPPTLENTNSTGTGTPPTAARLIPFVSVPRPEILRRPADALRQERGR